MVSTTRRQPETCDVLVVTEVPRLGRNLASLAPMLTILQYHNILVDAVAGSRTLYALGMFGCDWCRGGEGS